MDYETEYPNYNTKDLVRSYRSVPDPGMNTKGLIDSNFPSMGVIKPSHLGSQSVSPRGDGDYEENLNSDLTVTKMSPLREYNQPISRIKPFD